MVNINSNFFLNTTNTYTSSTLSTQNLAFADVYDVTRYQCQFGLDPDLYHAGRLYSASWSSRGFTRSRRV